MTNAIYLRLSASDGDLGKDGKDESNSIENQRLLLHSYLKARPELQGDVVEYADDGYTGTNFNRPAFKRMLEDAKQGKVNVILVKDLSRLGRDYIVAGDYIEQIFPLIGVRFIAVNNGYDSAEHNSGTMGFDVAVNNLINTFYSRDLSKKIKSGNETRWRQGISTSSHAPYGYDKSKTEKGKYVIDPEAAEIVKLIFAKAADGYKTRDIARILNEEKISPPWEYLVRHNNWTQRKMVTPEKERLWDCSKVSSIIRQYDYTGAMVIGRRRSTSVGGKNLRVKPKETWTVVEDVNEAIVSRDLYDKANDALRRQKSPDYMIKHKYPLKGKIRCGNCRNALTRAVSTYKEYFICSHGKQIDKFAKCCKEQYPVDAMEHLVWRLLKEYISILKELGLVMKEGAKQKIVKTEQLRSDLSREMALLKEQKIRQYESYADGRITREAYLKKKAILAERIQNMEKEISEQDGLIDEQRDLWTSANEIMLLTEKYANDENISTEIVDAFINDIFVYDPRHVEIVFRFEDELKKYNNRMLQGTGGKAV